MDDEYPGAAEDGKSARAVRREFSILTTLILAAVVMFGVTRAAEQRVQALRLAAAQSAFAAGQERLQAKDAASAIEDFRKATVNDPSNRSYKLALGRALAAANQVDDAEVILRQLRDAAPEDPDINIQLARIEASRGQVDLAVRYYRNALYGAWKGEATDARYELRLELIRFLLTHEEREAAVAELVIVASSLPDDPAQEVAVGQLLLQAQEYRRAQIEFEKALRRQPGSADALIGAGTAAFDNENYKDAIRYLRQALVERPDAADVADLLQRALVLSQPPSGGGPA